MATGRGSIAAMTAEDASAATRARFARLVARPDDEIDLALGALLIAADARPGLRFEPAFDGLGSLAERVRVRLDRGDDEAATLDVIHGVLFREAGFRAPTPAEYHDVRNSHLDRVLERRVGLPISLAIVELEVAWRNGLELRGIGLPGHFILGAPSGALLDPAGAGRRLTPDDCQALIRRSLGERVLFHSGMVRPVARREILARVLRNLRAVLLAGRDWRRALGVVELLAIVEPADPDHERDRGLLLGRMGRFSDAVGLLGRYLDERPDGSDAAEVRRVIGIFGGRRN
jgi:regulator of sirC expression with transglutaminase-like and TPR domain